VSRRKNLPQLKSKYTFFIENLTNGVRVYLQGGFDMRDKILLAMFLIVFSAAVFYVTSPKYAFHYIRNGRQVIKSNLHTGEVIVVSPKVEEEKENFVPNLFDDEKPKSP